MHFRVHYPYSHLISKFSFFTLNTIFAIHTCFTPKLVTLADLGRGKAQPYSEII